MNLEPSDVQLEIAATAASFLSNELPLTRLRETPEDAPAIDDGSWQKCAALGWLGVALSEVDGGVGLGLPDEVMLFRELGRHLAAGPFLSSVIGARLASLAGNQDLVSSITAGSRRAGMDLGDFAIDVRPGDLVLRLGADGGELVEVADATPIVGADPTLRFARITVGDSIARAEVPALLDRARVLVAAQLLGIIEAVRDMSAAYAQTRIQFDKPIGAFQAVKHRCADMAVAAYATVSQVFQAALLVDAGAPDARFHAASAYLLAVNGAKSSTADNIQNMGGIGFTWEHDAHLFLKRALVLEFLLGSPRLARKDVLEPVRHES
jgi:alkylation response protein AidB-like acyl-CoA dehydrogenase